MPPPEGLGFQHSRWVTRLARDARLHASAVRVALTLATNFNRNDGDRARVSQETLARESCCAVRHVKRALDAMVAAGCLATERRGQRMPSYYWPIYDQTPTSDCEAHDQTPTSDCEVHDQTPASGYGAHNRTKDAPQPDTGVRRTLLEPKQEDARGGRNAVQAAGLAKGLSELALFEPPEPLASILRGCAQVQWSTSLIGCEWDEGRSAVVVRFERQRRQLDLWRGQALRQAGIIVILEKAA